jgi:hypothetical protein
MPSGRWLAWPSTTANRDDLPGALGLVLTMPGIQRIGWSIVAAGIVLELLYHGPELLFGAKWPLIVATFGEFGHTVVFVGFVVVIFGVLRAHSKRTS